MAKITLNPVQSGFYSTALLNQNFADIEAAIENTLSLDGTTPNSMNADLDMNGNSVLNVDSLYANNAVIQGVNLHEVGQLVRYIEDIEGVYDNLSSVITASSNIATINQAVASLPVISSVYSNLDVINNVNDNESYLLTFHLNYLTVEENKNTAVASANTAVAAKDSVIASANALASNLELVTALLGAGIGQSYIDGDGDLFITYAEGVVDSIYIDSDGYLTITYT